MSDEKVQVTHVEKVTGRDGTTAYHVEGGSDQGGKVSGFISPEQVHQAEKQGRGAVDRLFQATVETLAQHAREHRQ